MGKSKKSNLRRYCSIIQRILYVPKQLQSVNRCDEFADAEVEYIFNYSNNIIKLSKDGKSFYFKEARERCPLRKYIEESLNWFFSEVYDEPQLRIDISQSLKNRSNFKKLVTMGNKDEEGSSFNEYLKTCDERVLGLPTVPEDKKDVVRKFIFYIYGEINNHFYNFGVKNGKRQSYLAVRAIAVKKLADMLSLGHIIPQTEFVKLIINGNEKYGTLESEAIGANVSTVPCEERRKRITPQLLRELTSLNVLDVLCYDNDHRVNNYHTLSDEQFRYVGVTSFDNDAPDNFFPSGKINFKHSTNCSRLVDSHGFINRPHMDRTLAECVLKLNRKSLKVFCNYLNSVQTGFLWKRIRKLQKAILKTSKARADFLLDKDDWTTAHIKEDLSGKYGKTYLVSFLNDCYYFGGLHPFDMC